MEQSNRGMGRPVAFGIDYLKRTKTKSVICLEAASAYWGMCSYSPDIPILLMPSDSGNSFIEMQISMMFVTDFSLDNTVDIGDGVKVTDRERTVCDMIRYNRHEFHLYETVMSAFEDGEADMEKLIKLARKYNIEEKLYETYKKALEAYDEDNEQ